MKNFSPLRQLPAKAQYGPNDILVVFGEVFQRGYVTGIIDEAKKCGMKVIYSTVGVRDANQYLQPLSTEQLQNKEQPLINVPLEAGFDMEPDKSGWRPIDQLKGLGLKDWQTAKIQWQKLEESKLRAVESFRHRVGQWAKELDKHITANSNVVFAHTMAGGIPRAKVIMPAMNRVFKGSGERFASSQEFWETDLGKFCDLNFYEVTANTLKHLIDLTAPIRERQEKNGKKVSYVAYGYHGTEVWLDDHYHWQSYSPYLQGFAKLRLEQIARDEWAKGVKVSVFNAPEILTNSSSVFLGVEIPLYLLISALKHEAPKSPKATRIIETCAQQLNDGVTVDQVLEYSINYFKSDIIRKWTRFDLWPQHNGLEQMNTMREASNHLLSLHKDENSLATVELSEVVFRACGDIMLSHSWSPQGPVWWLGHDVIAKQATQ